MGGGGKQTPLESGCGRGGGVFTWEEVQRHSHKGDQWLVIDRKVYNITDWVKRHPGGARVIGHYAGEDATDAFTAFHPEPDFVRKFLKPLLIGELATNEPSQDRDKNAVITQAFRDLREQVEREGFFRTEPLFFCLHLGHIILLEALAFLLIRLYGTGWLQTLLCALILATSQSQAGWLQHDFGHLSVFKKSRWNHLLHKFVIGHLKGASANWWNHRHFQHHAKPNIFSKDPDVNMLYTFVLGKTQPVEYGIKKIKYMPYHHQHQYFFLIGPPMLIPVYFHIQIMHTMFSRRDWVDLVWSMTYYLRYFSCYVPFYGLFGSVALISFVSSPPARCGSIWKRRGLIIHWSVLTDLRRPPRPFGHCKPLRRLLELAVPSDVSVQSVHKTLVTLSVFLESHWFVWVTQMNHIPMHIDHEKHDDWLTMQLKATCNIEQSLFNDWFSGHLNFQIEHHLFPTMPRHNYSRVAPLVRQVCERHGVPYQVKSLYHGFRDVVSSLRESGDLWLDAYLHK